MASESPWHIFNLLRLIDRFGQPIPAFNISGKNKINTVVGGILTSAILTITLGYFVKILQEQVSGSSQIITFNVFQSYYGPDKGFNMSENNQRIAIAILGNYDWLTKYDRKYVRLVADLFYETYGNG